MGTNFYWKIRVGGTLPTGEAIPIERMNPRIHLGKRSAAGPYCWDCRITLCKGGERRIHHSDGDGSKWWDRCPQCGGERIEEGLGIGVAAVELGFAEPRTERPKSVRGAASWSWAQDPKRVEEVCKERPDETLIEDEYGTEWTCRGFMEMLDANCPIRFTDSIGQEFS